MKSATPDKWTELIETDKDRALANNNTDSFDNYVFDKSRCYNHEDYSIYSQSYGSGSINISSYMSFPFFAII